MIIIPDANSVISALIKKGKALDLFEWNDFTKEINLTAPEYLSIEIRNNLPLIMGKSTLSEFEVIWLLEKIESQIEFIHFSKFEKFIPKAIKISPPDDFQYVALALFLKSKGIDARILSNDKELLEALTKSEIKGVTLHGLLKEIKLV